MKRQKCRTLPCRPLEKLQILSTPRVRNDFSFKRFLKTKKTHFLLVISWPANTWNMGKSKRRRGLFECTSLMFAWSTHGRVLYFVVYNCRSTTRQSTQPDGGCQSSNVVCRSSTRVLTDACKLVYKDTPHMQAGASRGCLRGLDSPDAKEREKAASLLAQLFSSHDEVRWSITAMSTAPQHRLIALPHCVQDTALDPTRRTAIYCRRVKWCIDNGLSRNFFPRILDRLAELLAW